MQRRSWNLIFFSLIGLFAFQVESVIAQSAIPPKPDDRTSPLTAQEINNGSVFSQWMSESIERVFGESESLHAGSILTDFSLSESVLTVEQVKRANDSPSRSEPGVILDSMVSPASVTMQDKASDDSDSSVEKDDAKESEVKPAPMLSGTITSGSLLAEIERQKTVVGDDEQMDELQKADRLEMLTSAHGALLKATAYRLKKDEYEQQLAEYPEVLQNLEQELAKQPKAQPVNIPLESTSDSLDSIYQQLQRQLQEQEDLLIDLQSENKDLSQRITEIPKIRATSSEELDKVKQRLATISDSDEDVDAHLGWLLQNAKKISLETQLVMLDAEIERQKLAGKVLPLKRDRASRLIKRLKSEIATYETAIANLRRQEVRKQAQKAKLEAINAHPALQNIATRNQELTQLRTNITNRIQSAHEELSQVGANVDALLYKKQDLESKISSVGVTRANGMLLVESRRNLASPIESHLRIKEIRAEQQTVSVAILALEEERKTLSDPAEFVANELGEVADQVVGDEPLSAMAIKFVQTKREYLDDLLNDYNQYLGLLSQLSVDREFLIAQISDLRSYIDREALWVRNADPLSMKDVVDSTAGLQSFFAPKPWNQIATDLVKRVQKRPHESALGIFGIFVLLIFSRRLKQ